MDDIYNEELTYLPKEPAMEAVQRAYQEDMQDLGDFVDVCQDAYDQRNCRWPNKSKSQRKEYKGAKPWIGASDQEVPLIEYGIDTLVELCMNAFDNGHVQAEPIGSDDIERGAVTSQFMRWMMSSWIPNARQELELACNHLFEKRQCATYVGWERKSRRHEEEFDIEDIALASPDLADMLMDESIDESEIIEMLGTIPNVESISEQKAKIAIRELRKTGVAQIPVMKSDVNRPVISTKALDCDVILPYYTTDPQRANRVHVRFFMSSHDLLQKVFDEDWHKDWVNEVIENHMGMNSSEFDGKSSGRRYGRFGVNTSGYGSYGDISEDMIIIVRTFQRYIDPIDGATAIYETVWSPSMGSTTSDGKSAYGKFAILNGWDEYPIAFTRYKEANKRWYDVRGPVDALRGTQRQAKVTRDGMVDQTSLMNSPPRTHKVGSPAQRWGADADIPVRKGDEGLFKYLEVPNNTRDNVAIEEYLDREVDKILGLTENSPIALQKQQANVNRFLLHVGRVARLAYKAYQKFGEDEIHFRITGVPDPITMNKSTNEEEMDIKMVFDSRMTQPDYIGEVVAGLDSMMAGDRTGRLDPDAFIDIKAALLVPQYMGRLIRPTQKAQEDINNRVSEDLAKIAAKIPVNANPQGADTAMAFLAQYESQPDVQEMLQTDIGFAQRYGSYKQQYEMQLMQNRNAEIGRNNNPDAMVQAS